MDRSALRFRQILFLGLLLAAVYPALPLQASWQLLPVTFRRGVRCAFFFDEQRGFIGNTGDDGIYRTGDAGVTWRKCVVPVGFAGDITQIFMSDTLNGWATIEEPQDLKGNSFPELWQTTDGGLTWRSAPVIGSASCVYQTSRAVITTSREVLAGFSGMISSDGGKTFGVAPSLKLTNGVDFADDQHGVVTGFESTPWLRSADGGLTWIPISPAITDECWSVYAVKGTSIFYTVPERDPQNTKDVATSYTRRSSDFGITWVSGPSMPCRTTGHIAGTGEILYVQNDEDHDAGSVHGLYRSTDRGQSWQPVGGPSNQRDTRFVVLGCNGGVVYAFDSKGQIWKTRDGGDGTRVEPPVTPTFNPPVLNLTSLICANDQATIVFKNLYCKDMEMEIVGFADSTLDIVSQGGLHFSHVPSIPKKFGQGEGDSIVLQWDPKRAYHHDTTITTRVHIRYYSNALGRLMDTLITVMAHAAGVAPQFVLAPQSITIDTVHPCLARDTTITLLNIGCDTLFVKSADLATVKGLTLLGASGKPVIYPFALPPGGAVQFKLHMAPGITGDYASSIRIHFRHQGIDRDSTINFTTFVPFENVISTLSRIDVGPISVCRTYDSVITIRNPSCGILTINSIVLKYGNKFSLPGLASMPVSVLPDSTFSFILKFSPATMTPELDSIILTINAFETPERIAIPATGSGTSGTAFFHSSLSPAQIDFGTRTHCDIADSVVFAITNPGCVPMMVLLAQLEGALGPGVTMRTSQTVPSLLIDGDTLKIVVHLSTAIRGGYVGNIHLRYQFPSKPIIDSMIPVNAKVIHGSRTLSIDTSARNFGSITFCDTKDDAIIYQNTGCDSLTITQRDVSGLGYVLLNGKTLPLILASGERDTFKLRFIPVVTGSAAGTLSINSDADSNSSPRIRMKGFAMPTDTLTFFASAVSNAKIGDTIGVRIYSGHSVNGKKLSRLKFTLNYNGDILTPVSATNFLPNSFFTAGPESRGASKTASYPIEFTAMAGELTIDSSMPMITVIFQTSISDSSSTNLIFSDIQLNGGDQKYQKCTLGASSSSTPVSLILRCGDSTIKNYFLYKGMMPLTAHPVYPDPAYSGRSSAIEIPFAVSAAGPVRVDVINLEGKKLYSTSLDATIGENTFEIPRGALSEGAFNYSITYLPTQIQRTGKFVIIR